MHDSLSVIRVQAFARISFEDRWSGLFDLKKKRIVLALAQRCG